MSAISSAESTRTLPVESRERNRDGGVCPLRLERPLDLLPLDFAAAPGLTAEPDFAPLRAWRCDEELARADFLGVPVGRDLTGGLLCDCDPADSGPTDAD